MIALLFASALAVPRETVLDNAALYAAHVWESTAANQYATCSDDYESDYSPGEHVGVPYDWGGYMSLDEFDAEIADGYGAGSHSWHGILSCTAGVDCSGFISMTWETTHYTTSTFDDGDTHTIGWTDLERGDAINDAGSHVVLYTHETDAGWPVFYEAAGSAEKVRINASGGWSYVDGYQPIRFDDIEDGPSTGTRGEPREITAFPFSDFRWTAGAASDVIDSYSCAPSTDESGPEVMYHFVAATAGTLELVVSDDVGVDVDIHVLTAADGDACVARDDTEISVNVDAGDVWIVADTYVGSEEFPGPYVLSGTFTGTLGDSGVDDTDSPEEETGLVDSGTPETPDDTEDMGRDRPIPHLARMDEVGSGCGCVTTQSNPGLGVLAGLALFGLARRRRV